MECIGNPVFSKVASFREYSQRKMEVLSHGESEPFAL